MKTKIERFMEKIEKDENECWNWIAALTPSGYGSFNSIDHKTTRAHRVSYEIFKGEIPNTLVIDHLCKNKKCVNPDHLEAVSQMINVMRSNNPTNVNRDKTHCIRGHEFTEENTYYSNRNNERNCKTCKRLREGVAEIYNKFKTHCKNGHEFTIENTKIKKDKNGNPNFRKCRTCDVISTRKWRESKKIKSQLIPPR